MNKAKQIERKKMQKQKELKELKKDDSLMKKLGNESLKKSSFFSFLHDKKKLTAEDTLPFIKIHKNGICKVEEGLYNKVLKYEDINYELLMDEEQGVIFSRFASFLNSFDSSISLEFSFVNQVGRNRELKDAIDIPNKNDGYDDVRYEFRNMLKEQLAKGNNGVKKDKYIVYGVKADNLKQAKLRLDRLELDMFKNLKQMGVRAESLDGVERLKLIHDVLRPSDTFSITEKEIESFDKLDFRSKVCPEVFKFSNPKNFQMGDYICHSAHFIILASELSDRFLAELLSIEDNIYIGMHIEALDQVDAIKMVKRKNTDVQRSIIDEQQKAMRSGYDIDIIPSDLNVYGRTLKGLLQDLQTRDEKMFVVSFSVMNLAKSKRKLDATIESLSSICNKHNCSFKTLSYMQEQGMISAMPFGANKIEVNRILTSSSTAVFMPFTTEELFISSKSSLYYGLNALSHNLIMADRKRLKNPNGLILGTPGSGKSFAAKREMANAILVTDDDVIICDPEGEYANLVKHFGGEVIKINAKSKDYLNPLDINMNYGDGDAPLKDKANFIMSMLELVVGGSGLSALEKSVIDRCLPKIYEKYFNDPVPENMPILEDLYEMLKNQEEQVGKKLATEMEIYVSGSLNVFNHHSNIDLNKQLLCFDIKELGTQLKKIGMLVIQDQVWNKVSQNRGRKSTRYYIDEFHLLLRDEQTAQYSVEIWKRFRKWGGIPTGITQNVKDLLASMEIENIFDNTDFILMLNQASGDQDHLAKKLKISPQQMEYVKNSNEGTGLLFFGNTIVPFEDKFPKNTLLYKKMTTKPDEVEGGGHEEKDKTSS